MTHPRGGFYSAEHADSLLAPGAEEKREGAFYVWSEMTIDGLLETPAADLFKRFGIQESEDTPRGSDPHGEFKGLNIFTVGIYGGTFRRVWPFPRTRRRRLGGRMGQTLRGVGGSSFKADWLEWALGI